MVMEDTKTYIVSLGDSKKYRATGAQLKQYEEELKKYLSKEFAGEPINFYDSTSVEECSDPDAYPELTHVEFEKVKTDLKRQLEVRAGYEQLDSDAPYSDVNPDAL